MANDFDWKSQHFLPSQLLMNIALSSIFAHIAQ